MEKLLELENVSYSYQDGKEKNQILDHASYLFEKGKIYAVVGASGSGKTTTLSLASGLDKPDDGKVLFKGKDIQEIGLNKYRREDISIVFQSYNLIYYMNALENVHNVNLISHFLLLGYIIFFFKRPHKFVPVSLTICNFS